MPNIMTRQHMERVAPGGWLYLVADNKDYRIKVEDLLRLVTKESIGLGKVENTSDVEKPISEAVREALNRKINPVDLENLVTKLEFTEKVEDLTARLQALIDRQPETPPAQPNDPAPPAPSVTVEQIVNEITAFWNNQKAEGGDFKRVDTGLASVSEKASNLETQLQNLEETVQAIPRVTDAARQSDLAALSDRVNQLSQANQDVQEFGVVKGKVEALEPRVDTLDTKLIGLNTWNEFKGDYDRVAEKAQAAYDSIGQAGEGGTPDMYLQWLKKLQYTNDTKPSYGAVAWHDSPTTYLNEKAYYKIEPYFASMAVYYALQSNAAAVADFALRWLNWWMKNQNATTGSTLIHYTDGEEIFTELPGAQPEVPANNEDATDSNIALFFMALERYISLYGTQGLYADWKSVIATAYDKLSDPALKDTDGLTWAKTNYRVKYLMDNVEVRAGLIAAESLFSLAGDATRSQSADDWQGTIDTELRNEWYDQARKEWKHTRQDNGDFVPVDTTTAYPDALAQVWPSLFGMESGVKTDVLIKHQNWAKQGINAQTRAADPQLALHVAIHGHPSSARRWLMNVAVRRQDNKTFTWPFTCADAAITSVVAKLSNSVELSSIMARINLIKEEMEEIRSHHMLT